MRGVDEKIQEGEGRVRPISIGTTIPDSMGMSTLVREDFETDRMEEESRIQYRSSEDIDVPSQSRLSAIERGLENTLMITMRDLAVDEEGNDSEVAAQHTRRARLNAIERSLETIAARLGIYNGSDTPPPSYSSGPNPR